MLTSIDFILLKRISAISRDLFYFYFCLLPQVLMQQQCFADLTQDTDWSCPGGSCNFEGRHGGPHVWVGGDMATFCSPSDPVFWLHHGFIDCLWEWFRDDAQVLC